MYENELAKAKSAAREAGREVMKIYNTDFRVDYKKDENPVTQADLISEKIILKNLSGFDYGILSEETREDNNRLKKDFSWIIDPLDGTSDFVGKTGEFTIMIALAHERKPVIGVVYQPVEDIMYYGAAGLGSFKERPDAPATKIKVSKKYDWNDIVMLTSRFHLGEGEVRLAREKKIKNKKCGSAGLKACLIADAQAELNINTSSKTWEWDVAAADIILSEAGGKLTDMSGREFIYNKKDPRNLDGYVATNGVIHEEVVRALK